MYGVTVPDSSMRQLFSMRAHRRSNRLPHQLPDSNCQYIYLYTYTLIYAYRMKFLHQSMRAPRKLHRSPQIPSGAQLDRSILARHEVKTSANAVMNNRRPAPLKVFARSTMRAKGGGATVWPKAAPGSSSGAVTGRDGVARLLTRNDGEMVLARVRSVDFC